MPIIAVPRSAIVTLAVLYALMLAVWLFLLGVFDEPSWISVVLSIGIAAVFVSFGIALVAAGRSLGAENPAWLSRGQAVCLAAISLVLQALFTLPLTFAGAWPHKDLWFLGAIPFLWRS